MFSKDITSSDAFLDMPASSQALYFHFGMEADDDGFIGNPKKVMRVIGVGEDDFKILISKKFVLLFPSGVLVVKHHRINNNWDKYNCKRTNYLEEFSQLYIKDNRAYTFDETQGVPLQSADSLKTVFRIEENRIDNTSGETPQIVKVSEDEETPKKESRAKYPHSKEVFGWFPRPQKSWAINTTELKHAELLYERGEKQVRAALRVYEENKDDSYCPDVSKPSYLEQKWPNLLKFSKKHAV